MHKHIHVLTHHFHFSGKQDVAGFNEYTFIYINKYVCNLVFKFHAKLSLKYMLHIHLFYCYFFYEFMEIISIFFSSFSLCCPFFLISKIKSNTNQNFLNFPIRLFCRTCFHSLKTLFILPFKWNECFLCFQANQIKWSKRYLAVSWEYTRSLNKFICVRVCAVYLTLALVQFNCKLQRSSIFQSGRAMNTHTYKKTT